MDRGAALELQSPPLEVELAKLEYAQSQRASLQPQIQRVWTGPLSWRIAAGNLPVRLKQNKA